VKLARNDLCGCGSGKKYKKCCGLQHADVAHSGALPDSESSRASAMVSNGRYHELETFAHALIDRYPNSGFPWKFLGFAQARQGKDPLEALRSASALLPDDAEAHGNLGNALRACGKTAEALRSHLRAIDVAPAAAEAYNNLGTTLVDLGRLDEAEGNFRRAIILKPDFALAHANLANRLRSLGRLDEAIENYRSALAAQPNFAEVQANAGDCLIELGQPGEALVHYQRALELKPGFLAALTNMGMALRELGRFDAAEASYRQALRLKPDQAELHVNLAVVLHLQGRNTDAEQSCGRALESDARLVSAIVFLAKLWAAKGQFAQAEQLLREAISIAPLSAEAWAAIPSLRKMDAGDTDWLAEARQIADQHPPARKEMHLRYAIGKYYDDVKEFPSAFSHFRRANELAKQIRPRHDRNEVARFVAQIIRVCDESWLRRRHPDANLSQQPVFVVGMPRSGTTLCEQIMASHPAVFGAGELTYWGSALAGWLGGIDTAMAEDYLRLLGKLSSDATRVIDKMPGNFLAIGLIHAVLPNARIIHVQRNPIDTCVSIYFQDFETAYSYANDLDDLAHYYAEYVRLMRHWRSALPEGVILDVSYEGLVEDQERWSRAMFDFIGLPWDPRSMDFHLANRVVNTVSNWQVRQKINRSSIERWRNYQEFLEPLRGLTDLV
jgi:tetratricopeptide (TPR) repeat protein